MQNHYHNRDHPEPTGSERSPATQPPRRLESGLIDMEYYLKRGRRMRRLALRRMISSLLRFRPVVGQLTRSELSSSRPAVH